MGSISTNSLLEPREIGGPTQAQEFMHRGHVGVVTFLADPVISRNDAKAISEERQWKLLLQSHAWLRKYNKDQMKDQFTYSSHYYSGTEVISAATHSLTTLKSTMHIKLNFLIVDQCQIHYSIIFS